MSWPPLAIFVLLLLAFSQANAACTYEMTFNEGFLSTGGSGQVFASRAAAKAYADTRVPSTSSGPNCQRVTLGGYAEQQTNATTWSIDATSTWQPSAGSPGPCPSRYRRATIYDTSSPGSCTPNNCLENAGAAREVNFTVGYTRTANDDDYALVAGRSAVPAAGSSMCDGQCQITVGAPARAWHSVSPSANGLYRTSVDVAVTVTATSCTAATPEIDPLTPPAPCDGTVGYINGKRTCVKSTSSPDTVVPAPAAEYNGNPRAGTEPNPTTPTNPAGREPTGGTGGPDGGPPSGSAGGVPRGTGTGPGTGGAGGAQTIKVEIPDLKDPCGIPGSPPCKIDETGTPDGNGAFDAAGDALDGVQSAAEDLLNEAAGTSGKDTSWGFSFSLPTGCTPLSLPAFAPYLDAIDICEWQPMIHDLLSLVWVAVTIWTCIGMVGRTAGAGA